uniref:Uncharacterized protein n=1 Tax=Aegilops tauschii subsp. strangulata TaxID=200361 RepID=A0A453Q4K4_AEGTS
GGQGGGRAPGREPLLGAPAHRHGGAGRRRGREGLQGAAPGPALRGGGAHLLVLLPGRDRRVPGHLPLPLHLGAHRDGRGGQPFGVQVRHGRHPGHRLELRRHDLRARLLHRRHLRRPHQPRGHLRAVFGKEAVAHQGRVLHGDAVPGRDMRGWGCQGVPDHAVPGQRRRRQLRRARVHQGGRPRGRDRRHVRAGVHRLLRHRRQAQRQRLPRPHPGPASDRIRGVSGAPGDDPHHGHRHQPGEVAGRRHHLQQEAGVGRPLDLLGWPVHRRGAGGHLPRGGDPGDPLQEPRLVHQSICRLWIESSCF